MHTLALLVGTALTLITGVCIAVASGLASRLERLLATLVIASTQIVVTLFVDGLVLRSLSTATVLVTNLVVTAAAVAIAARTTDLGSYVTREWAALRRVRIPNPRTVPLRNAWAWALAAIGAIETAYLALVVYVLPPATWDSLTYHLTAVAAWLQDDRILITPLYGQANVNPMNGELAFLWLGSLTRSDLWIDGVPFVFAVIGAVAVASLARSIGVSKPGSFVAASLYLLTPLLLQQATSNYVDLALSGYFLAGYALLLRYLLARGREIDGERGGVPRAGLALLVLSGAAVGLATGSKLSGVLYAAVAALTLLANILWWRRRTRLSWRVGALRFGAFVLPIIALGSFWYVRTWVEYGNPTYPYRIELAGVTLFDGRSPSDVNKPPSDIGKFPAPLRALRSWAQFPKGYTYDQRRDGFGPTWLLFELPALLIFAVYCALHRRVALLNFLVPFAVIMVLTPYNWWSRFIVLVLAPGAVALVFLVERIRKQTIAVALQAAVIVSVLAGCALSSKRYTIVPKLTPDNIASRVLDPRSERTLGRLILSEYAWTDTVPRGSRVGVYPDDVPFNFVYALFGTDFHNEVIGLSARDLTADSLLPTLKDSRIDYFVTRRGSKRDDIARANPGALHLVSDVGDVRVYRVGGAR